MRTIFRRICPARGMGGAKGSTHPVTCCDLPVGRFVDRAVESFFRIFRNISVPTYPKSILEFLPSHPTEGRIAIVTDAGCGCGGRGSVLRATGSQGGLAKGP